MYRKPQHRHTDDFYRRSHILKVQIPIVTTEPDPVILVYNQDRSIEAMLPLTPKVRRFLKGKLKSFWVAHAVPDLKAGNGKYQICLDRPAPWQEW